jgi:signal transduction histidine kinase/tetratricopeptide (TPR) repeat protein
MASLLLFSLVTHTVKGQTIVADSLVNVLRNSNNETAKTIILNKLSASLIKNAPQQAFEYNKQAMALAQKIGADYQLSEAYQNLAEIYSVFGDYEKGLEYAIAGLNIAERNKYDTLVIKALDQVSSFNFFLSENDSTYRKKVFEYRFKALYLAEKIRAKKLLISIYLNIGNLHRNQKNYDSAFIYTDMSFLLAQRYDDIGSKGLALLNKGRLKIEQAKYFEALPFLSNAYKYLMSVGNKFDAAFALQLTGIVHREKYRYEQAFRFLNDALILSQALGSKGDIAEIYKQLYITAEKIGKTSQAFEYYKKYAIYRDSVFNETKSRQIAGMQSLHDAESKDKEIELLKKNEQMREENLKQQKFLIAFLSSSFVLSGLIALMLYRNNLNKQKINQLLEKQNTEILSQQEEINAQKENIGLQNVELEKKNEALSFLNEEKNHLIGIVAHDLRNPLSQIKGLVSVLQMSEEEVTKEEKEEYVRLIKNAIDRMAMMINKTLDVNAIDSHRANLTKEKHDISAIFDTVANDFEKGAKTKNIQLIRQIEPQIIVPNMDKNYLTQIFENLISNAIKYSPSDTSVFLKAYKNSNFVTIEVRDEGQGISEEDMSRMFGKFQQLSAKPTKGEKSIGLGLSIVKKYVEAMGGKVWCESELGKGATFIVEFRL